MLAYIEQERYHVTISRSRKRVRFHWTSQYHRSGSGIEGSARIFAEEMGSNDAEEDVSENNVRAGKRKRGCIYAGCPNVLKLSESRMNFLSSLSAIEKEALIRSPPFALTTLEYIQIPLSIFRHGRSIKQFASRSRLSLPISFSALIDQTYFRDRVCIK